MTLEESYPKNLPKISVVTPSFNQGRFLEQCIQSVLDQHYPNLEFFVYDGGSTDESVGIIKQYSQYFDYWVSEKDKGQSDVINKGFRRATGELVTWLNSDDFLLPGAFTTIAEAYLQDPTHSFFFGNGLRVDENGKVKAKYCPTDMIQFNRQALLYGLNYILQPAAFIKRVNLEQVGFLDENLQYGMDTDLWLRLSVHASPMAVSGLVAASREYGTTKSLSGSFKRIEELRKIAEKYTGMPMTPGVLCYFLDTLHYFTQEHEAHFPKTFQRDLLKFWESSSNLLRQYGSGPDGTPTDDDESIQLSPQEVTLPKIPHYSYFASLLHKLANWMDSRK